MKIELILFLIFAISTAAVAQQSELNRSSQTNLSFTQSKNDQQPVTSNQENEKISKSDLSKVPFPTKKDCHPKDYYRAWETALKAIENDFENKEMSRSTRAFKLWNRFLYYFKMVPDKPEDILPIFMDAYKFDKHEFCAEYREWIPRLTSGEHSYCLEHYKTVKPVMDEIVRLVFESYDQELVKQFKAIKESDQSIRGNIPEDATPEKLRELLAKQREIDIENLKKIEEVISKHGYPGRSLVGINYEGVAFLVIQHSGGKVIEKYLPTIKSAIERNDLKANVYPYLFDRLEISKGRPQHFGTQRKLEGDELFPVFEPENLNERRKKYGLPAITIPSGKQK